VTDKFRMKGVEYGIRENLHTGERAEGIRGWVRNPDGDIMDVFVPVADEEYAELRERILAKAREMYGAEGA